LVNLSVKVHLNRRLHPGRDSANKVHDMQFPLKRFGAVALMLGSCGILRAVEVPAMNSSLVKITTTAQGPNYKTPWNSGQVNRGVGTGFIIEGGRILTNAHVVSNSTFITVEKENDPRPYVATPEFLGQDCDLAILRVDDTRFSEGTKAIALGGIPAVESVVQAYGYPLGGDRFSVTRGVVSRVDFMTFSHSGVDAHLVVQIDAAINPGNSGGPVMQDGKVVGVAFQGYSGDVAQNVGYMIPVPVIKRFLADTKDGKYDGYVDLAIGYFKLVNPAHRKALGLDDEIHGVMVSEVFAQGSADGVLKRGDVLLKIDGVPITAEGFVELDSGLVEMPEVVERKQKGEKVEFEVLRERKPLTLGFTLKGIWPMVMQANRYDKEISFAVYGGLVFQPLSRGLMDATTNANLRLRYNYENFLRDELYTERPEIIVLSDVLPDPVNTYLADFAGLIVDKVNGRKIKTMRELVEALDGPEETVAIESAGRERPVVLEKSKVNEARQRILTNYGVVRERNILPAPNGN
jgi:S1-C subfamily serine protease